MSNKKYNTLLECDCFNRPYILYQSASYHVIGQFVIGQSVIVQLDKLVTIKTVF